MNYNEWNNIISSYFFNKEMKGRDVYLYITENDIIRIGSLKLQGKQNNEIWQDYIYAMKTGYIEGYVYGNIIETMLKWFQFYKNEDRQSQYYPFTAYLILFILPLTIDKMGNLSPTNYYKRVNKFLKDNDLPLLPYQVPDMNWNVIWEGLENWAQIMDIGNFKIQLLGNPNWVYISKPLSQCILRPSAIKQLPSIFLRKCNFQNNTLDDKTIKNILLSNSSRLHLNKDLIEATFPLISSIVIRSINTPLSNKNLNSPAYVKKIDHRWSYGNIKLILKLNIDEEKATIVYRIYSKKELPEEIKLKNGAKVKSITKNFSEGIQADMFSPLSEQTLFLEDEFGKWRIAFKSKDIYFLQRNYTPTETFWMEKEILIKEENTYILCHPRVLADIKHYFGENFENYLKDLNFDVTYSFHLLKVINTFPDEFLKKYKVTYTKENLEITFQGMLRIYSNTFLLGKEPTIYLHNSESSYPKIIYKSKNIEATITRNIYESKYLIPDYNEDAEILVEEDERVKHKIKIQKSSSNYQAYYIPSKNIWGKLTENEEYIRGNELINLHEFAKSQYDQCLYYYNPILSFTKNLTFDRNNSPSSYNYQNDILLLYISKLGRLSFDQYYHFWGNILLKDSNLRNFKLLRKNILQNLINLGHIEIDDTRKLICINRPQLTLIPNGGLPLWRAVLTGARSRDQINLLIAEASSKKFHIRFSSNINSQIVNDYIMPWKIELYSKNCEELELLCKRADIYFNSKLYIQPLILLTQPQICDYECQLMETEEPKDYNNILTYNTNSLTFTNIPNFIDRLNVDSALIQYKYHQARLYRIWLNGKFYKDTTAMGIDQFWGRYFILSKMGQNILLYDNSSNSLAIPASTPLPPYFQKSLQMMSGEIPQQRFINDKYYNIYTNMIPTLIKNTFKLLGQTIINYDFN